jgi:hypothetical protein
MFVLEIFYRFMVATLFNKSETYSDAAPATNTNNNNNNNNNKYYV